MAAHRSHAEDELAVAIGHAGPTLRHVASGLVMKHLAVVEGGVDVRRRALANGAEIVVWVVAAQGLILLGDMGILRIPLFRSARPAS